MEVDMYQIQLPNDVKSVGYKQTGPFKYEQVFESSSLDFVGTEIDFVNAGHAYKYIQINKFTRRCV